MVVRRRRLARRYSRKNKFHPENLCFRGEAILVFCKWLVHYDPQWSFMSHGESLQAALP